MHKLYGELAASLTRETTDRWNGPVPERSSAICTPEPLRAKAGAALDVWRQSYYQDASNILATLGVAHAEQLIIDGCDVANFVTERSRAGNIPLPPIDVILDMWIWCALHFMLASVRREPFVPHQDVRPVVTELVTLGYATPCQGGSVIWTDKIGPAMRISGHWNEDNLSSDEREERDVELEMRRAYATVPAEVRHAALRGDVISVTKALAARWDFENSVWLPDIGEDAPWYKLGGMAGYDRKLFELITAGVGVRRDLN